MTASSYIGRFAPSPTGPLHFGSLVAALGSYLQARAHGGQWHVRMEDIDTPRCSPVMADDILRTLAAFGFEWTGAVMYQSQRLAAYRTALQQLQDAGWVYACGCSRLEIADSGVHGIDGLVYPGSCRDGLIQGHLPRAQRVRTDDLPLCFDDALQGRVCQRLASEVGDFVLNRADGLFAYQLAVVVDDAALGITEVVRGADLLASTPRQIYLQRLLGLPTPTYLHLPVALNADGQKLSKQTQARALKVDAALPLLCQAMAFLNQPVREDIATLAEFWRWATAVWSVAALPQARGDNAMLCT
ncbi:tRNA glutamyl-Q(34) synthetase GluQRS [Sulfuriferula sp.]|uniref:tRNA glutamyl-Q(34) synthetase GluQRS n=1 Tax=Sulfuriferula sp. TaxID=2025307 RepID=UPI00272F2910|nr:tRNA glutamyl-Q(34) synthetase GluQRS [Sulfuriferula sp.]MDP2024783.1 tRNA glutamyl-Q(34) synthetase GluQRS [Sulfuriferula sp.]